MTSSVPNSVECEKTALEFYKVGHQQLLMTMQKRDRVLYLNLVAQATLLALSLGISVGSTAPPATSGTKVLSFAIPIAFIFALLYVVEDGAVTLLSKYLSKLCGSDDGPQYSASKHVYAAWVSSSRWRVLQWSISA